MTNNSRLITLLTVASLLLTIIVSIIGIARYLEERKDKKNAAA